MVESAAEGDSMDVGPHRTPGRQVRLPLGGAQRGEAHMMSGDLCSANSRNRTALHPCQEREPTAVRQKRLRLIAAPRDHRHFK
jgi:hypothetical protein